MQVKLELQVSMASKDGKLGILDSIRPCILESISERMVVGAMEGRQRSTASLTNCSIRS